ncbi:MAG: aminotransferase class V-fold PLP-dependent enzyme, partial [Acidobacteriota bacterium]
MPHVYLDHNATSPLLECAARAMRDAVRGARGNPSSVHRAGREARRVLEEARGSLARCIGGAPGGLVLTSGATEGNNLALHGLFPCAEAAAPVRGTVVTTAAEHASVRAPCDRLRRRGHTISVLPVAPDGTVARERVRDSLAGDARLLSIQLANPETGVIQPIAELAAEARRAGVVMHVDAAQALGRIPVDVEALGVDLLTLSAHKLGGPVGVGALWVREGLKLAAWIEGGGQEGGRRGGTENVVGAVGFAAAAVAARDIARMAALRDRLEEGLCAAWPGAVVHGAGAPRLPNTTCIGFPGLDGPFALARLDLEGIAASLGSACSIGTMRPS